uniref:Uncharacterized protein n=1 Tax=Romanomermis culicivorax TaxID=13658 RepID=A0A915IBD1_ROMCU
MFGGARRTTQLLTLRKNFFQTCHCSLREAMAAKRLARGMVDFAKIANMVSRLRGAEGTYFKALKVPYAKELTEVMDKITKGEN